MTASETGGSTRRRFLRTAANVGVGAGLVWSVGTDYAVTADTVEIEYALVRSSRDGESLTPRTKTVPADWYASTQTAFDIQETVRETALPSLFGSFVVPGSFDDPAATLAVDATTEDVVDALEDVAGTLQIDVSVIEEIPPKPDPPKTAADPVEIDDLERQRVPGGVHCESPQSNGTLAPCAYDVRRGDRYFLTSNHVFGEHGTKVTDHRDEPLNLTVEDETRTIGRVERGFPEGDFVRVTPVDGNVPIPRVARADPPRVVGQFTRMGLADMMARDERLHKFGAYSGHTAGEIMGVDGFTCYVGDVCKSGQLKWGDKRSITDGDSGSINFAPDPENPDEYVIAGGLNNARNWWPGVDFTWGTAAYQLLDEYGLHF